MATRLVVFEVSDTQSEDDMNMAIAEWNRQMEPDRQIVHRKLYSCPVGNQRDLDR